MGDEQRTPEKVAHKPGEKPGEAATTAVVDERAARQDTALARIRAVVALPETVTDANEIAAKVEAELNRLRPLADIGTAYRADLIDEVVREGNRAMDGFGEETYRAMLANQPLEQIKRMRDDFAALGDKRFAGGGRQVVPVTEPTSESRPTRSAIPDVAFQV